MGAVVRLVQQPPRPAAVVAELVAQLDAWTSREVWSWPHPAWLAVVGDLASKAPSAWESSEDGTERALRGAVEAFARLAIHADDDTARLLLIEGLTGALRLLLQERPAAEATR